jgi:serine/threonine-protein kinase RsbW
MVLGLRRESASVGVARRIIDGALRAMGAGVGCRGELVLALSEACTNAVKHAVGTDGYEVRVTVDDDRCVVEVIDAGRGVVRLSDDPALPGPAGESGRGLSIIAMCSDSVQMTARQPHGFAVRFTKRLT